MPRPNGTAEHSPLLHREEDQGARRSDDANHSGFFFEHVAEGIQERDRERMAVEVVRYTGFIWAIVSW